MLVTCTQLVKKRKESKALASCIKRTSFEMFLCSRCEKRNLKCVVLDKENSGHCSKYVLQGTPCDVKGIPVREQCSLKVKEERLEHEREAALLLTKQSLARARCLKKQQKFLKSKGKDIVCRGLKTLDELEEVKERERQIETERAAATQIYGQAAAANPFARIKILLLPLEVWANQDFASETPQASQGN